MPSMNWQHLTKIKWRVTCKHVYENLSGKLLSDEVSQAVYSKYELSTKVKAMVLKNGVSTLPYKNIMRDVVLKKHFKGLARSQFEVLNNFLDTVSPLESIHYWTRKDCPTKDNTRIGPESDFPSREKLVICLQMLKRRFAVKTPSALLCTPDRKIGPSHLQKIFTTFIPLMYVTFHDRQNRFPQRA